MKNAILIFVFALVGVAVFANYHGDTKKCSKAKGKKECCAKAQANPGTEAAVPACCSKMKAEGKQCPGSAEKAKTCSGHSGGAELHHSKGEGAVETPGSSK